VLKPHGAVTALPRSAAAWVPVITEDSKPERAKKQEAPGIARKELSVSLERSEAELRIPPPFASF